MSQATNPRPNAANDVAALIERVLTEHAPAESGYDRMRHREYDVCACGTRHPAYGDGRWPTHRRHVAEQIARVLPPTDDRGASDA